MAGGLQASGWAPCATALRPKARQLLRHWLSAKPFCRARPVRAPLAGKCLRAWQSAPQRGARRCARPAKGKCFAQGLSSAGGSARPAKVKCFAQGLSPAGGSAIARESEVLRTGPFPCRRHPLRAAQPQASGTPTPHHPLATNNFFEKFSPTPLRAARGFAILSPSADGPGSRKERDGLVLLGG